FLQLQDFAAHVNGDLTREVPTGDGRGDFGNVAHLGGEVARHRIDVVGEVLPSPSYARHLRLAAEFAVGAHFTGHAGHFPGKGVELIHHGVQGVLQLQDLALDIHSNLTGEVAARHGGSYLGDIAHLARQVTRHRVHTIGEVLPGAAYAGH